jgi:acetyl-CoA C-acetyltransferase
LSKLAEPAQQLNSSTALVIERFAQLTQGDFMKDIVILGGARTPIGSFLGTLIVASPRRRLGARWRSSARSKTRALQPEQVQQVIMGNVLQAAVGQAPARQAGIYAGVPE